MSEEVDLRRQLKRLRSKLNINFDISKNGPVDFIFIALHGIGTNDVALEHDFKSMKYCLESVKRYWFYRRKIRIHLYLLNWKKYIVDAQNTLFDKVYIDTVKDARRAFSLAVLDIAFYLNPKICDYLLISVAREINDEISKLRKHPSGRFKDSKVVLIGYSMGSVIAHELISDRTERLTNLPPNERPRLKHKVDYFFAIGSPLGCTTLYQSPQIFTNGLVLPDGIRYYNVFHPYDPVAFRLERIIYKDNPVPDPVLLPYWQNNGFRNWYDWDKSMQQAKSLIVDNITDVASSISKSIFGWWGSSENSSVLLNNTTTQDNRKKAFNNFKKRMKTPNQEETCETTDMASSTQTDENEAQQERGKWTTDEDDLLSDEEMSIQSSSALDELNNKANTLPVRYDFQLQEDTAEHYLNPLAILQSHLNYWSSKDLTFFILKSLVNIHETLPITALFTAVEAKAKSIAVGISDKGLKEEFIELAEHAKKEIDRITKEDLAMKAEASSGITTTLNVLAYGGKETNGMEPKTYDTIEDDGI